MKGNSVVVACVASGAAMAPFCAYRFRPASSATVGSVEEWLVSLFKNGEGVNELWWAVIACAVFGFIVGLLVKYLAGPGGPEEVFHLPLLRTPIAGALLAPVGAATILLVAYNHTPQAIDKIVRPDFYFEHLVPWSIIAAFVGAISSHVLNDLERAFETSPLSVRMAILCCWPLALCVGVALMAGVIGCGLLGGISLGQSHGCPIVGGWTGTCVAVILLAFEGSIFWPAYFPMTRLGTA